ncbi:glycerol kinase GlpK [Cocleimonas sp. KMM 6892]|uniref:glycerol kinase GlpK n=1 Tax=unclassified Cocleimonas TaxID=2639732 RepID=UPI002DB56B6D|nr:MULTISPECIES: glycerol kinase GlpK [unclassified Cocleimonas]MEB8431387.1 glycerol kinase GlpK [Cocleimonas sp. KMM 6892]MEC4713841.1 glycerol kinase GlpK [Cocleimonas sp. KMM 6895]MEC4743172.1 glycerol kinase GlpK [Cocleimonas sp. KMM 6896]
MTSYILAIDQGTTSSRAILFDEQFDIVSSSQQEFAQHFPSSGMVEHDAEEIWHSVVATCRKAIADAGINASQIAGIGITNQRETTVIWDKSTGKPIHHAIVWQDRRTSNYCNELKASGHEETVRDKTGLLLDPYFSATKINWLLDHVDGARKKAEYGKLLFGTIDTYLLWRLTDGASHKTDATNASRTMLFNTATNEWDDALLKIFNVPRQILPTVEDCAAEFGNTVTDLFGASIPVLGIAGDQHAAVLGQACFSPGMIKSTYGTGCFVMLNTGEQRAESKNRLLSTIAYRINGKTTYALEGSIFIAGAAVQWLRDGLKIIDDASQTGGLAAEADRSQDVIMVPAFAGLGAPYWEPDVRGAIFGLTRNTGPRELSRAALEAVCYQTRDLVDAMKKDWQGQKEESVLRVDGGMVASDWTMQYLADTLATPIDRPSILETTALGAAWLAGMKSGVWPDMEGFSKSWKLQNRFEPRLDEAKREHRYNSWLAAVESTISQSKASSKEI